MSRAATKRKAPPPVLVAPQGRDALARCIELAAEADRRVEAKREAVSRSVDAIRKAEQRLEAAQAGIAKAKDHDVRRASAGFSSNRASPASSSLTQRALQEVTDAEASLEVSMAARKKLEEQLAEAQDDAAERANEVLCAVKAVTVPTVEKMLTELAADKKRVAITTNILGLLTASERGPAFHNSLRSMKADKQRDAVLGDLRKRAEHLQFTSAAAEHFAAVQAAITAWSRALSELRLNPACRLPGED